MFALVRGRWRWHRRLRWRPARGGRVKRLAHGELGELRQLRRLRSRRQAGPAADEGPAAAVAARRRGGHQRRGGYEGGAGGGGGHGRGGFFLSCGAATTQAAAVAAGRRSSRGRRPLPLGCRGRGWPPRSRRRPRLWGLRRHSSEVAAHGVVGLSLNDFRKSGRGRFSSVGLVIYMYVLIKAEIFDSWYTVVCMHTKYNELV